jgi:hypothetical protein
MGFECQNNSYISDILQIVTRTDTFTLAVDMVYVTPSSGPQEVFLSAPERHQPLQDRRTKHPVNGKVGNDPITSYLTQRYGKWHKNYHFSA